MVGFSHISRAALVGLVLFVHGLAFAAEIKVDSLNDSGAGSLRDAVARAADGDTILLRADGTIVLQSPIAVRRSLVIKGQNGPLSHTLDGNGKRIFEIARNRTVTLAQLTLKSGQSAADGGAINSQGALTLQNLRLVANSAAGQGGAVFQSGGSLVIDRCCFSQNTAGSGGAVAAIGAPLTVGSSGFYGNSSSGAGGALLTSGVAAQVRNSTFSGNTATGNGGGVFVAAGSARLVNLTLVGNNAAAGAHAAAAAGATLEAGNSLIAGADGYAGIAGAVVSLGNNLADGPAGAWTVAADLADTPLEIGMLTDLGGMCPTYSLNPGSPAIDGGSNAIASGADQRGFARFCDGDADGAGKTVDIGAFEVQLYVVSALQIFGSSTGGADDGGYGNPFDPSDDANSIASADVFALLTAAGKADIGDAVGANNAAGGGAVAFAPALVPGRTQLKGSELEVRRNIAILGPGADRFAIDGDGRSRVMRVSEGAQVYLNGIAIENGVASSGGGLLVEGGAALVLDEVSVSGNRATAGGGALAVSSGSAYVLRSALVNNTAAGSGGAISVATGASAVVDTSTVSNNLAGGSGGAAAATGSLWVDSSTLAGNTATVSAPALAFQAGASGYLRNSIFAHGNAAAIAAATGATVQSSGHNISTGPETLLTAATDRVSTDPRIGTLALNGGTTLSHVPQPGGPAINAGDNADVPPLDQPGFTRIRGRVVDIGSVEFQNDPPEVICPAPPIVDCVSGDGATVDVTVFVDDLDGDAVTVTWRLDGAVFAIDTLPAGSAYPVELTKEQLQLPIGSSTITVTAADSYAVSPARVIPVSVLDRDDPAIALAGDAVVALECGVDTWTDPGATATDTCDSNPVVSTESELAGSGPFTTGTYSVTYTATDASGNSSSITRTVVVSDNLPPVVTLNGDATVILECGIDTWSDPGATAGDLCTGSLAVSSAIYSNGVEVAAIGTGMPGSYEVVYTAVDAAGNQGSATRAVEVRDTLPPVVTVPADFTELTDPGYCSALIHFSASATDNCAAAPAISFRILPGDVYPDGQDITSPHAFEPGVHTVECTATDASGNSASATFQVTVTDDYLNCVQNTSWPNALPLSLETPEGGENQNAQVRQFLALTDQARWYRFNVQPGSRVTVILSELPANYDIVVYKDIAAEYQRLLDLFNSPDPEAQELALLGVEFAPESFSPESFSPESFSPESFSPESFSPESFSPESFSPESFSPESFSPESFSPESFSPESFSPESFSPESFSPESFSPESFSPESFSPESFSPESFSAAQVSSMIAYSAFPGVASEGVAINTFTRSGEFYIRVRGYNGSYSVEAPFRLNIVVEPDICDGLLGAESFGESTLAADAGGYKTIVLWDSTRTDGTPEEIAALEQKLDLFAARPEVAGVVVDVSLEARVVNANLQADSLPACPYAKNLVAAEIKALVSAWRDRNPDLQYVVLLGNDDDIPFFRTADEAFLANESNYIPPVIDATHSQSSLRYGQVLTQDPYGAACELNLVTGPFAYPEMAVGRLVESAADMMSQLDNYLATADGILPAPGSALVTGYDFLDDGARAVQYELEQALGGPVETLIADASLAPSEGWTAVQLGQALFGARHDLVYLAGHFSTGSTLAADYETRLTAAQVLASGANFVNTLVFSAGCHSGYNTVDAHAINGITKQPDWAQAFAKMGAILVAGTGYQYGDTEFVEYGERLYLEFSRQLRTGSGPVAVGDALVRAKRKYFAETPLMRGIHEKSLVQATLFGLPMARIAVPGARLTDTSTGTGLGIVPAPVVANPGLTLGLEVADISLQPQLTPRSLDLLNIEDGSTVTARWFEGRNGFVTNPAEPTRPLEVYLASVDGTLLRGVGFRGGRYEDLDGFLPLTGAPTTEIRGVYGNFFSEVFFPVQPYSLNYLGTLCGGTDGETRLNIYPAQFLATGGGALGGTMRTYADMDFRLFYNNNRETYNATGVPSIPALSGPPSIAKVRSAANADETAVEFVVNVLGNPAAGIQQAWITYTGVPGSLLYGEWRSLDLAQDADDSTLWKAVLPLQGALPDEVRFMVQAVSGTGMVALNTNFGHYYEVGVDDLAARIPTQIELVNPPAGGAFGESLPVTARLTSGGQPLAGVRLGFRIGNSKTSGFTGADGVATVLVPLTTRPSEQLLQAYFQGDREYAPSAAGSQVTVVKQATVLAFQPLPPEPYGSDVVVALETALGTPLKERTVFFLVDYGTYQVGNSVITDFAGRADLSELDLPGGDVVITAYFNGTIPVPGGDPVTIPDDLYLPAVASISVTLAEPPPADDLAFDAQQVDVHYKSTVSKGRTASVPVYENASVTGEVSFAVPLQPWQLLANPSSPTIEATVEARLAGQLIASEVVVLDTRGDGGNYWTTTSRPGKEVSFVGIHWSDAPRFDSALSTSAGPRIYTTFIGNKFSEIHYVPVAGSYRTVFPDGKVVVVKNGAVDVAASTALSGVEYTIDADELTLAVAYGIAPGMTFTTLASPSGRTIAAVPVTEGVNFLREGGRMIVRLAALDGTPQPASDATPNLFEARILLGSGPGETVVRSTARIGEGRGAVPWSSEDPNHKQYRP